MNQMKLHGKKRSYLTGPVALLQLAMTMLLIWASVSTARQYHLTVTDNSTHLALPIFATTNGVSPKFYVTNYLLVSPSMTNQLKFQIAPDDTLTNVSWNFGGATTPNTATGTNALVTLNTPLITNATPVAITSSRKDSNGAVCSTSKHQVVLLIPVDVIEDTNNNHQGDTTDNRLTYVRLGLWDNAFDGSGNVLNGNAETGNFVGSDSRRFYLRIYDPSANHSANTIDTVTMDWYTQTSTGGMDDDGKGPSHSGVDTITLTETGANTGVFVSKALILVSDEVDNAQPTNTGLSGGGSAAEGAADHRLRRASLDDTMCFSYTPAAMGSSKSICSVPVFNRSPDERKQLTVNIINYLGPAVGSNPPQPYGTQTYIDSLFSAAQDLWTQVGLKINQGSNVQRPIPTASLATDGTYQGSANTTQEAAILNDLIPITADNTLTVIILPLGGANAYTTIAERTNVTLENRYFIFINNALDINDLTLAHELFHALYNRFDDPTSTRQFFPFNTMPPDSFGVTLPDVRIYRRIQASTITPTDWLRQAHTGRFPIGSGIGALSATTGNTLIQNY